MALPSLANNTRGLPKYVKASCRRCHCERNGSQIRHANARQMNCSCCKPTLRQDGRQAAHIGSRRVNCSATEYKVDRRMCLSLGMIGAAVCCDSFVLPAYAGLVMFPADKLQNRYILVRAGEAYADAEGVVSTNPVNKENHLAELTSLGKKQVIQRTVPAIAAAAGTSDPWIWTAIHSSSYQTAALVAGSLGLRQNRVVPEYKFLDPRGVGAFDGGELAEVQKLLQAGDASSSLWKPPRGYDGTPNESVQDVLVRVRQVISVTETQFDEELVVFIVPDSTVLSVLQAAVQGINLNDHWKLAFRPAEARPLELGSYDPSRDANYKFACAKPPACL